MGVEGAAPPNGVRDKSEIGEMAEWSKARAWKVRIPHKGIKGSNPFFSAKRKRKKRHPEFRDASSV